MKIIIFGGSGLIGRGVLRECLLDAEVSEVKLVGRAKINPLFHPESTKLTALVMPDLFDYSKVAQELTGFDACFFCLGVGTGDMANAKQYERLTYTLTLTAASALAQLNPKMTLTYVSGAGTNARKNGAKPSRNLWMRVKGKTEDALLALPFKSAVMFRPAFVQAMNGEVPRSGMYRVLYLLMTPLIGVLRRYWPKLVVTTEQMGRAMLAVAKNGSDKKVFESLDIGRF